jgi:hypothetical protein
MARLKRTSPPVAAAQQRASGLASIDAALDLGNGLTLTAYTAKITSVSDALDDYNTKLSELDGLLNDLEDLEGELDELSVRMLTAVAAKYGKDSDEYEKAGGTRTSERKKPKKKATPPTPPNP